MDQKRVNLRDKKLKIIAGIGSASDTPAIFEKMVHAGLNIVRVNMSHGTHEEHHRQIVMVREIAKKLRKRIGVFVDLSGPKIRIGEMQKDTFLEEGKVVVLTTRPCIGNAKRISVNYSRLPREVKKNGMVLLSDGKKQLKVISTNRNDEIRCRVIVGGLVTSRRGVNTPGARLSAPAITKKDKKDFLFAIKHQADFIGMSFVRKPGDIKTLRRMIRAKKSSALIISKLETVEAIEQLPLMIEASDSVMVARGDLSMEVGPERVPVLQKRIIEIARSLGKPAIVATQILDSMERSPIPTRAEISDIATAIYDGADAIMLSGETAYGKYPIEAVTVVSRVAQDVEASLLNTTSKITSKNVFDDLMRSTVKLAMRVRPKAIAVLSVSPDFAHYLVRTRMPFKIIGLSSDQMICNQLTLSYGVTSTRFNASHNNLRSITHEVVSY